MEKYLAKLIQPIIIRIWNSKYDVRCIDANVSFAYFPKDFTDQDVTPRIRFKLIFWNGKIQDSLNCSKIFVDEINSITEELYRTLCKITNN